MFPEPPGWTTRFLRWFCHPDLHEDLEGDLYEMYHSKWRQSGKRKADIWFIWLVFRSFRTSALTPIEIKNSNFIMMTNNYKIALRVLWRDRFNTLLNLSGLTIGITCFLLLGFYVKQEVSFDHFHSKKDRIYRSWLKEDYGSGKLFFNSLTPPRFEGLFEENFPEVETAVQFTLQTYAVNQGEDRISEQVAVISPEFFEVFDFALVEGNTTTPLPSKDDIILSKAYARKYFGDQNPLGEVLRIQMANNVRDFRVSAIFEDMPVSSSIRFDIAMSTANNAEIFGERALDAWFIVAPETYVLLKENSDIGAVESKTQDVVMSFLSDRLERDVYNIGFQPLTDIHLNPSIPLGNAPVANPQYVYTLGIIGFLVLFIACINYTTLSIGQSLKRAHEVGIRKVLGAQKPMLVQQYLSESILIALAAMAIGTIVSILLIPTFNALTNTNVIFQFEWWHALIYLGIGLSIGLAAGSYPALILSAFNIINALRGGTGQVGGGHWIKKGMVVFQFLITVFLISCTITMRKQINFLQSKDLGYEYGAAISVALNPSPEAQRISERISTAMENGQLLKSEILKHPEISNVAMGTHVFGTPGWAQVSYSEEDGTFREFRILVVDPYYLGSFGIDVIQGRDFEPENGFDERQGVILNKVAADYFGFDDPIGRQLPGQDFGEHRIVGVAENFHFSSLHSEIEPLIIVQNPVPIYMGISDANFADSIIPKLVFTYRGSNLTKAVDIIEAEWEKTFPNDNLRFDFLSERIRTQYENEARMNKLIAIATALSIIIACLGLLGLTVLVVNSRVKEIGIRKVMGATPFTIFGLLSKSMGIQLIIAILLSVPVTVYLMQRWLENFAYRVTITVDIFVLSAIVSLLVATVVIMYHTFRAARINPVESLRAE